MSGELIILALAAYLVPAVQHKRHPQSCLWGNKELRVSLKETAEALGVLMLEPFICKRKR